MTSHLLTNAHIVTPTADFIGTVKIQNSIIAEISQEIVPGGTDLNGDWLIPGCIDIHTDYLEKELLVRAGANFPLPFAIHFLDARAASCGITTVFSAVSFSADEAKNRSLDQAIELSREIDETRDSLLIRHFLHARIDPNSQGILAQLESIKNLKSLYLVVYNDHIPGERQFKLDQQIEMRALRLGIGFEDARQLLTEQIAVTRQVNNRQAIYGTFSRGYVIGSHDDTTTDHVLEGVRFGATLCEMPTTLEAARKARELGMAVCMGAPNYLRGGSHCGNLSCEDALQEDLVDILCSDYHFPTLLASVLKMIETDVSPSRAVNMVSLNPAKLLHFDRETGSIEKGKRADLVVFSGRGGSHPRVSRVFVDGVEKYTADYSRKIKPLQAEL